MSFPALRRPSRTNSKEVTSSRGTRVLGCHHGQGCFSLDYSILTRQGFVTPATLGDGLARDIGMVKRRLFRRLQLFDRGGAKVGRACPIVMVTSGRRGEGKTFSAVNLALSLVFEERLKVLLVDGDLTDPGVAAAIGIASEWPGLCDCLEDREMHAGDVILRADGAPLSLMLTGKTPASPASLLKSDGLFETLERLRLEQSFDVIILDGPPVLATTEAAVLGRMADEVILVIRAGEATRSDVEASIELLDLGGGRVSLLLNRAVLVDPSERADPSVTYGQAA